MSTAFGKSHTLLRRDICGWAAIPLLEKDKALPLEITRSPGHLPGKHSPTAARASDERPGVPIAQLTC